ncbi:MAG: hypothetical protein IPG12_01405 [Saprospiraceae bacterium]|nr:hypothetical protein [Saprospiraceae bacterium]
MNSYLLIDFSGILFHTRDKRKEYTTLAVVANVFFHDLTRLDLLYTSDDAKTQTAIM